MRKFLHMHHAMANKAVMLEATRKEANPWKRDKAALRSIILSGKADYRSRWENIVTTGADREIVLRYLAA